MGVYSEAGELMSQAYEELLSENKVLERKVQVGVGVAPGAWLRGEVEVLVEVKFRYFGVVVVVFVWLIEKL